MGCPSPNDGRENSRSSALNNLFFLSDHDSPHFRIIPSVERWPRAVDLAKTVWGKLCILLAYFALFASCGSLLISWEFFLLLGFVALAPIQKGMKLFAAAIAFSIFLMPDLYFGQATNTNEIALLGAAAKAIHTKLYPHLYLFRAAILAGCLLLFALIGQIPAFRKTSSPLPVLIGLWLLILLASLQLPKGELPGILAGLFAAKMGLCLCWASYLQLARQGGSRQPSGLSTVIFPLFGAAIPGPPVITNPAAPDFSAKAETSSSKSLAAAVCRIKGLKILLWTRILLLLRSCTVYFFFGPEAIGVSGWDYFPSLHWPNYQYMGVANYTALHISPLQTWVVVLVNLFVDFFLRFGLYYGLIVAVVRLSGFYVPRFIVRPYLAKTFNEYYRRSLYFYSEAVVHFFFLPAWRWLYVLRRHKKLRLFLSLFLSLGIGGWFLHMSWAANYFLIFDWPTVVTYFLSWAPYYALISIASWWSATGTNWRIRWLPEWATQALTFAALFTAHALLLSLLPRNPQERWDERVKLIASLFHFS